MSAADLRDMIHTVADRFKFQPSEIKTLTVGELHEWYDGAIRLNNADSELTRRMFGAQ